MCIRDRLTTLKINNLIPSLKSRGMDLGTERMTKTLKYMTDNLIKIPAIQIVGTNGKGSIASFLESALKGSGLKVGVTTSPHLVSWCERIKIDGEMISKKNFPNVFRPMLSSSSEVQPYVALLLLSQKRR